MSRQFTGRHMAAILIAFFAVIVTVNMAMARFASSTFGGVVVENSYVASQHFNRWLDQAAQDRASGLEATVSRTSDGRLAVILSGASTTGAQLTAVARHPVGRAPDQALRFDRHADGSFVSREPIGAGRWRLRLELDRGADTWRTEQDIF